MGFGFDTGPEKVVTIKVIGVGGGGGNVVNRMVEKGVENVEFITANTDKQALGVSQVPNKIQLGEKITNGQGAGSKPEIGREAGKESRSEIEKVLQDTDMIFVTAGMGGGTGTGAAPVVAEVAKAAGILTVGVVTKPFAFEGKRRMRQAMEGIQEFKKNVDALIIIPNDRLKYASDEPITYLNAFSIADDVLRQGVQSITDTITKPGIINCDFADVCTVMRDAGMAHMGVGRASGKGKEEAAVKMAIASPLLETSINGARGVLVNLTMPVDTGLFEIEAAGSLIEEATHPDADVIIGTAFDPELQDEIHVTVIATGFDLDDEGNPMPFFESQSNESGSAPANTQSAMTNDQSVMTNPQPAMANPNVEKTESEIDMEEQQFNDIVRVFDRLK